MATTPKHPLFDRNAQYGWYDYGAYEMHPANIWFVGSCVVGCSNSAGYGMNPDSPFATLDYAVGQCTNSTGDVIYVLPGHVEVLTAAGGLDLDVIGISIRGIGEGIYQPRVELGTIDTVDVDVDAASITVENINFVANVANIVAAIDVNATDFTLRRCRFTEAGANLNALIWIQDAAAAGSDRITVEDCAIIDNNAANTHFINFAGTGTQHVFRRNTLSGDWGTVAIGGAGVVTDCLCADNYVYNIAVIAEAGIHFADTATGLLINNRCSTGNASATQMGATAMVKCENYGGLIGDANGPLEPIIT